MCRERVIFMRNAIIYPTEGTPALDFAVRELRNQGVTIATSPSDGVTHILLPVPTTAAHLATLPQNVTVIGGNLDLLPDTYPRVDLLQEEQYLAENAAITADCALRLLGQHVGETFRGCPMLIIGWGRIGKCLGAMLKALEADVTIAARKASDLGMLTALGYPTVETGKIDPKGYRVIINTAPAPVLEVGEDVFGLDLASRQGLTGKNVLWARGLPGKMLPQSSGACIARGVLRHLREE